MGYEHPPRDYDEATLQALEQAFRDVLLVLKAHDLHRDWGNEPETKKEVAEMLMALADAGDCDLGGFRLWFEMTGSSILASKARGCSHAISSQN